MKSLSRVAPVQFCQGHGVASDDPVQQARKKAGAKPHHFDFSNAYFTPVALHAIDRGGRHPVR